MEAVAATQEPYAGKVLENTSFVVDETVLNSYFTGLGLTPEVDAPLPSTLVSKPDNDYILESGFSNRFGHLWVRQGWEFLAPLLPGVNYGVRGKISDIYPRRDRNVVNYQAEIVDPDGNVAVRSDHHQSFLQDPDAVKEVALRDPGKKPGASKFEIPEGEAFGGLERKITAQMCGEFFHGKENYHTDIDASKALGFKDIVVGGRMTMAYAAHILEQEFGDAWTKGGRMDVKFINPTWVNDTVTIRGIRTGPVADAPHRAGAFVWVTRTDGTVVLVGSASANQG
jgi:hypothetical protein